MTAITSLPLTVPESVFQATVIEYAERNGWTVAHFNDSRREIVDRKTGVTKLVGDQQAKGFPDLVLVRDDRLIFAELKATDGRVSVEQERWLYLLSLVEEAASGHVQAFLWKPVDWPTIERVLKRSWSA